MVRETSPLVRSEFHSLPVLEAGLVLGAELDAPGFGGRALFVRDMRLELDGIGARRETASMNA